MCWKKQIGAHACKRVEKQIQIQIQSNRCTWQHFALFLLRQVHGLVRLASSAGLNRSNPRGPTPSSMSSSSSFPHLWHPWSGLLHPPLPFLPCCVRKEACFYFTTWLGWKAPYVPNSRSCRRGPWEWITTCVIRQTIYIFMRNKLVWTMWVSMWHDPGWSLASWLAAYHSWCYQIS
jgi:hypothetical protein